MTEIQRPIKNHIKSQRYTNELGVCVLILEQFFFFKAAPEKKAAFEKL